MPSYADTDVLERQEPPSPYVSASAIALTEDEIKVTVHTNAYAVRSYTAQTVIPQSFKHTRIEALT